jgi:hypothetical protein
LLLLPLNFRGGGEASHGHSLLQLWADAVDGTIDHHHHAGHSAAQSSFAWLDPEATAGSPSTTNVQHPYAPDVGDADDSMPTPGTIHLLIASLGTLIPPRVPTASPVRREVVPVGRSLDVLIPPPRMAATAA